MKRRIYKYLEFSSHVFMEGLMSNLQDVLIVLKNWEVACTYTHPLREFLEAHGVVL